MRVGLGARVNGAVRRVKRTHAMAFLLFFLTAKAVDEDAVRYWSVPCV